MTHNMGHLVTICDDLVLVCEALSTVLASVRAGAGDGGRVILLPLGYQDVKVVLGFLQVSDAPLEGVPADVLDDVGLEGIQAVDVCLKELDRLHLEDGVVGLLANIGSS